MKKISKSVLGVWQKKFAWLPVVDNRAEGNDLTTTTIWLEEYWSRTIVARQDRSLKTQILSTDEYLKLWLESTIPFISRRLPSGGVESHLTEFFIQCYMDRSVEGANDIIQQCSLLVTQLDILIPEFLAAGVMGEEVVEKSSGLSFEEFKFRLLSRVWNPHVPTLMKQHGKTLELPEGHTSDSILSLLMQSKHFADHPAYAQHDYLQQMLSDKRICFTYNPKNVVTGINFMNSRLTQVELNISVVAAKKD